MHQSGVLRMWWHSLVRRDFLISQRHSENRFVPKKSTAPNYKREHRFYTLWLWWRIIGFPQPYQYTESSNKHTTFFRISAHAGNKLGKYLQEGVLAIFQLATPHGHYKLEWLHGMRLGETWAQLKSGTSNTEIYEKERPNLTNDK